MSEMSRVLPPPYGVVMKPYGAALVELARRRPEIVCLGADLTRQTETDLFRDALPDRFFNIGMAEANMIGVAGGLARAGHIVFVNTFGVFATRRCYDQLAMSVAYPKTNVKIVGFMPGISTPGGPSHQAIDDIALMRALPNMKVLDLSDATEISQAVGIVADEEGPVYLRLKRGEIPKLFDSSHALKIGKANLVRSGNDALIVASGMMVPGAIAAAEILAQHDISVAVLSSPSIKPLDASTIALHAARVKLVVTAENHSIIGGLGSAVAEALAEAGVGATLRRIGLRDEFAESGTREYLFRKYGLDVQAIIGAVWRFVMKNDDAPTAPAQPLAAGLYSPV
jgi:transketolase